MTKENTNNFFLKIFVFYDFRGPFKKDKKGPKGLKVTILVKETYFWANRLNMTKENRKTFVFLKFYVFDWIMGLFVKRAKMVLRGQMSQMREYFCC